MESHLCDELTKKFSIQPSSTTSEKKPEVNKRIDQVPYDADDKCKINIFADIIPILAHDNCKSTNFNDWRKQVEHVTNAFPLTCKSKGDAINFLNIERERLLELLWCEKEQFQKLLLKEVREERKWKVKEAKLEHELFWKRMQLEGCRKSLQDLQEQFDEYKGEVEPLEEPEWLDELLKDN
ncbi:hypothetical protein TanjilG_14118 [Lupinus angustifolius]|uniref:Uncharacterized protein n=1 Tax=Lupinus angustifolius TaxID=3871 RepID=A0A1J7IRT3_LUPAN|nr:hypothetical protein TanjilG_14118 [Lupinus angustifolius]